MERYDTVIVFHIVGTNNTLCLPSSGSSHELDMTTYMLSFYPLN